MSKSSLDAHFAAARKAQRESTEAERRESLRQVEGTLALEGLHLTEDERSLLLASARGEFSHEEFLRRLKALVLAPRTRS